MLVEALRRHLELARKGLLTTRRFPTWLDDTRRGSRLLALLDSRPAEARRLEGDGVAGALVDRLIDALAEASLLGAEPAPAADDALLDRAVQGVLTPEAAITPSNVRDRRLANGIHATRTWLLGAHTRLTSFDPLRYADELQLVHHGAGGVSLRRAGDIFLDLRGRDSMRWLLALEVESSLGDQDPWRLSLSRARALAARSDRATLTADDPSPLPWPWDYPTARLEWGELVEVDRDHELGAWSGRVTPIGAELFDELDRPSGEALRSLARSVLADEFHGALHGRPPVVSETATLSRHTQMVAHELRNALVPVQFALKQLRRRLAAEGFAAESVGSLDTAAAGLERALRFARETARMASHGAAREDLFGVVAAIRDAVASVQPEARHPIDLDIPTDVERVHLRGWRDHFVLAVLNLLRNAIQAGGEDVRIFVACATAGRVRGALLTISIEDDGPGVPPDPRADIFAAGVSHRADGTGQGLAFVREVVEDEFKGSVHFEPSPRGGARFVLRLPIPLEGQP